MMTIENAGALVRPRYNLEGETVASVKVKLRRATMIEGEAVEAGKVVNVDEKTGRFLLSTGKAVPAGTQVKDKDKEKANE